MIDTRIHEDVFIPLGDSGLPGELEIPQHASSLVLFSHGSGSSRLSPRNQFVAESLRKKNIGTFLFDLLAEGEDTVRARFDISLLTERLIFVTEWLEQNNLLAGLNIGYFGASTGAASALYATAILKNKIKAVVSRGGRPDLALEILPQIRAATMLIVGSWDEEVLELNRKAFTRLHDPKQLVIVPGATHLFEEPGRLEQVAVHAARWFSTYLDNEL